MGTVTRYLDTAIRPGVDIDLALRSMLQRAFADSGVRVDISFPGMDRLPSVSAVRAGGVSDWPPGAVDRPRIDINCYATKRQEAINLALDVVAFFKSSEGDTITFGDGTRFVLVACDEASGLITGQDETVENAYRGTVSVTLVVHQISPMRSEE